MRGVIIYDTLIQVMRAVDKYGQMFLKCILHRMKELGVSQSELATRMKASRPYVSKALHGEVNITFASAMRFAKALQLDFLPQLVHTSGKVYSPGRKAKTDCHATDEAVPTILNQKEAENV